MITITGFIHRDALHDLIGRWMLDRFEPSDPTALLQLVHFNSVYVARYLPLLAQGLLQGVHGGPITRRPCCTKGDLKDQLAADLPSASERARRLVADYRADPGRFYRETPFRGTLYFAESAGQRHYVGSSRIKRIRRLAEKSARKVVDWLCEEIVLQARSDPRFSDLVLTPCGLGGPTHPDLLSDPDTLDAHARALLDRLRATPSPHWPHDVEINDVAGIKVVMEPDNEARLAEVLGGLGCRLVEREVHRGDYSAVNLLVDFGPDKDRILAQRLPEKVVRVFRDHGVSPSETRRRFETFVRTGEPAVRVEIICSDAAETLESEIGRCMHEERIIRQRLGRAYQGHLSQNVEFLLEYLFSLPAAPEVRLECLPVRLWERYLPDYFDEVKRVLFRVPSVELNPE
ncbi:hypothetical protein [Thiocapsa bogorovii]|uniref:hypothetical protein n=1 Tax=Thiocapsa bogorovii TaxID=521689 RepID=UPI001E5746B9|nr:hypothetical protein [Thiocapsa bogorovii]UHD15221.1 hypothetical protein LT988_18370 [Thiocapsa bogorovii]